MLDDFKRALARVHSDYEFYIGCQTNPAATLAGYVLSPDEVSALSDPKKLATALEGGIGVHRIMITISGRHDWVNRAKRPKRTSMNSPLVGTEVEAIKQAKTDNERTQAVLRLIEQID